MPKSPSGADWLTLFSEYLRVDRGLNESSISHYMESLNRFRDAVPKDWAEITTGDVRVYINDLLAVLHTRSVQRHVSALRQFFKFVFHEKLLPTEVMRHVHLPKAPKAVIRQPTVAEIDAMIAAIGSGSPRTLRNRAILHVAFGSGLRVSEIVHLQTMDVNFEQQVIKVRQGKGGKDRLTPMNPPEIAAIREYLERGRPALVSGEDRGFLFLGRSGHPLTRQMIHQISRKISQKTIGRPIHPHAYRHSFVSAIANGGADIRVVQVMAGHKHLSTTTLYLHADFERVRACYLKTHPRGVLPCEEPCKTRSSAS